MAEVRDENGRVSSPDVGRSESASVDSDEPSTVPGGEEPESVSFPPPINRVLGSSGSDVGRAALERARKAARARGLRPGGSSTRARATDSSRSGPGRDGRDPVPFSETLDRLATERGWNTELSVGGVIGRWREVVGDQVADHCTPETYDDGVLTVRTDSTAWATNLKLLVPELLGRLATELGPDAVSEVHVVGPAAPRWAPGRRQVRGRGPRDTYG